MDERTKQYLDKCRANGLDDNQIFTELTKAGWTATDANQVLGRYNPIQNPLPVFNFEDELKNKNKSKWSFFKKTNTPNFKPTQLGWIQWILGSSIIYNIFSIYMYFQQINLAKELDEITKQFTQVEIDEAMDILLKINIGVISVFTIVNIIAIIGIQKRKTWAFYLTAVLMVLSLISGFIYLDFVTISICSLVLIILFRSKGAFN